MKPANTEKPNTKKNKNQFEDDNIRYKLNTNYFNSIMKGNKIVKNEVKVENDDNIRYKFPEVDNKSLSNRKIKGKQKIKVKFWSNKNPFSQPSNPSKNKKDIKHRHTIAGSVDSSIIKKKHSNVRVRKKVSFLPSPLFSENHIPMVAVPDDLTIELNEDEVSDFPDELNAAFANSKHDDLGSNSMSKECQNTQTSTRVTKRKRSYDNNTGTIVHTYDNDLEYFSKYVVQKLRKMKTDQRIYSENLINTVLMLGQLDKLNVKSKITET